MPRLQRLSKHEQWVADNATSWTACRFDGNGKYTTVKCDSLDQARDNAYDMVRDRPVLIFAVFRNHQASIETINPGERKMSNFNLVNISATPFVIRGFSTIDQMMAAVGSANDPHNIPIARIEDLQAFNADQLLSIYNFLAEKPVKAFAADATPEDQVWSMITTGKPFSVASTDAAPAPGDATPAVTVGRGTKKGTKPAAKAKAKPAALTAEQLAAAAAAKRDADVAKKEAAKKLKADLAQAKKDAAAKLKAEAKAAKATAKAEKTAKAKPATVKVPKTYMKVWPGKPVRVGTSLERILKALMTGKMTLAQITAKSGVPNNSHDATDNVLHRIRHVLYVNHGVRHSVDEAGIYTGILPDGFDDKTMYVTGKIAAPKAAKAKPAAKATKAKPAGKGKKGKAEAAPTEQPAADASADTTGEQPTA